MLLNVETFENEGLSFSPYGRRKRRFSKTRDVIIICVRTKLIWRACMVFNRQACALGLRYRRFSVSCVDSRILCEKASVDADLLIRFLGSGGF